VGDGDDDQGDEERGRVAIPSHVDQATETGRDVSRGATACRRSGPGFQTSGAIVVRLKQQLGGRAWFLEEAPWHRYWRRRSSASASCTASMK
jgi:hypothetical protein